MRLVNALRLILVLSAPYGGRGPARRIAETTPDPLAGRGVLQALGCLACTLPPVALRMPTTKPRGAELPLEQPLTTQALHPRRLRLEPVHSRVKRCRSGKDRLRLWKVGGRDLVLERCCALHNCRVPLHPWLPD